MIAAMMNVSSPSSVTSICKPAAVMRQRSCDASDWQSRF